MSTMTFEALNQLPERTILAQKDLAEVLGRSEQTIGLMVERGELPPPVPFRGHNSWKVSVILRHFEIQQYREIDVRDDLRAKTTTLRAVRR